MRLMRIEPTLARGIGYRWRPGLCTSERDQPPGGPRRQVQPLPHVALETLEPDLREEPPIAHLRENPARLEVACLERSNRCLHPPRNFARGTRIEPCPQLPEHGRSRRGTLAPVDPRERNLPVCRFVRRRPLSPRQLGPSANHRPARRFRRDCLRAAPERKLLACRPARQLDRSTPEHSLLLATANLHTDPLDRRIAGRSYLSNHFPDRPKCPPAHGLETGGICFGRCDPDHESRHRKAHFAARNRLAQQRKSLELPMDPRPLANGSRPDTELLAREIAETSVAEPLVGAIADQACRQRPQDRTGSCSQSRQLLQASIGVATA